MQRVPVQPQVTRAQQGAGLAEKEQVTTDLQHFGDVPIKVLPHHRFLAPAQASVDGFQIVTECAIGDEMLAAQVGDTEQRIMTDTVHPYGCPLLTAIGGAQQGRAMSNGDAQSVVGERKPGQRSIGWRMNALPMLPFIRGTKDPAALAGTEQLTAHALDIEQDDSL
ncbi:hypothetical protein D3C87_1474200 [compost metagenome]